MPVEAAAGLAGKDVVGISHLVPGEIQLILDTAEELLEVAKRPIKKVPALRGYTVVNLFMEASTRTRFSFEVAEKRLSADTLNFAASSSSVSKGETLFDTARNLMAMAPDFIVIRHPHSGAPHRLARSCRPPSSTPATASTNTRPRRFSTRSPCGSASAGWKASRS